RGDVANVSALELGAHTGTHVDAPLHFIPGGKTVEQLSLDVLMGEAEVLDCGPDATVIDAKKLGTFHWRGATRILFKTRNSYRKLYDDPTFHTDFVAIAPDAAKLMADHGVKLVGIDYNSVEVFGAKAPETHRILLGNDVVIVEGLDLRNVSGGQYDLIVLPIKLVGREAAPARALLRSRP
ncbi:MAG TPA: cyclase family protein, partial [Candidatus Xenobia bacterium]